MPTRQEAFILLTEWTKSESLIKHMLAVEAAIRFYAQKFAEDEEKWAIAGLLHDFDYEKYPDLKDHPFKGVEVLKEKGYPQDIIEAILGHGNHTAVPRNSLMAKTLFAVDELCGFITACAYVRPDKLTGLEAKSVKKKLKDKSFAAKVSREDIAQGIIELGIAENEHIQNVITAMQKIAKELGF